MTLMQQEYVRIAMEKLTAWRISGKVTGGDRGVMVQAEANGWPFSVTCFCEWDALDDRLAEQVVDTLWNLMPAMQAAERILG